MLQSQNYMTSTKETKLGVQVDLFVFWPSLSLIFLLYVIRVIKPKFQDCLEYYDECIYWHSVRVQAEYVRSVVFRVTMGHLIMQLLQYLLL